MKINNRYKALCTILIPCGLFLSTQGHADVIQAEDYTWASDSTSGNSGGAYRGDDVDIETTTECTYKLPLQN